MSNTVIQLKKSIVSGNIPSSLQSGELAINLADGALFYKNPVGTIKSIRNSSSFSTINVNSTLIVSSTPYDVLSITGSNGVSVVANTFTDTINISVVPGSTTNVGVVQLYDNVDSNSTTLAATANSVCAAYTLAQTAYNQNAGRVNGVLTTNYKVEQYVANTGQTNIVTGGYTSGYISVFVNGILLDSSDYVATDGTNVTLLYPLSGGDYVSIAKWFFDGSIYLNAIQKYDQFTAVNGQSLFTPSVNYSPGYIKVYRNGILLENSEFTATNGANVTLTHAASNNDIVTLNYWGASQATALPVYQYANLAISIAQQASNTANMALSVYYTANSSLAYAQYAANTANAALTAYNTANTALSIAQYAANTANASVLQFGNFTSNTFTTTSSTANQVLDVFSSSTYRSVKYQVQVTSGSSYQVSEVSLIQDGTYAYITEYGLLYTGSPLALYDATLSGGNVNLLISPVNNINTIKFVRTAITV